MNKVLFWLLTAASVAFGAWLIMATTGAPGA